MSRKIGIVLTGCTALFSAVLAGTPPAHAFLFWGRNEPSRAPAYPQYNEPAQPKKQTAKKPKVRALTPTEKKQDSGVVAQAKGKDLFVAVSIARQRLVLYADGHEIAQSPISSGTASHPTPTGIFSIIQKSRHHKSNLYSNAPMPYMQRLTWSGVAMHQGVLPGYPASHGCVRLPEYFARQMWAMSKMGMRVVVTREPVVPSDFSHPALFKQKAKVVAEAPELVRVAQAATRTNDARPVETRPAIDANPPVKAPEFELTPEGVPIIEAAPVVTDAAPVAPPAAKADAPAAAPATTAEPAPSAAPVAPPAVAAAPPPVDAQGRPLRAGPVSVFISRREGKLYVRKQFAPVFETAITIEKPEQAIGTHLFTAISPNEDETFRWTAITMPGAPPADTRPTKQNPNPLKTDPALGVSSAHEALDRVKIPQEVSARISEMMSHGASVYVTDYGIGPETGLETDFIVWTRGR
ncbi:hypothetical protein GJW-30_1_03620 [Variibacter gotjawalensis]|uniref:L,D-TPase catalytic domain-containing protein n=1 Tax=Variibacter gotjawalensis TaxID=1333996 RepID=A0A0S3PYV0_9BRAD|nr:L,D-transpeptidase [Variibacter gotjawalensis]NIK46907.1 lipoprotein-anchoring transpeptidase ErfK/SrfK [Variibacter gotjawalensis]RZS48811.1 lipoprotein-anchoring transpeptidase ErfK/SrfK [Variibacter gotjawalensis]BAT61070.1 hypothetical protein GJW-30_1_03620 [Variibacter gotjawalensis]